jgi:hypothetical protein
VTARGTDFCEVEICSWQYGKEPLNTALPDVLAFAGTSVLALRKRTNRRLSFQDIPHGWLERKENCRLSRKARRGRPVFRRVPILSKTTGARDKRKFIKGLIV